MKKIYIVTADDERETVEGAFTDEAVAAHLALKNGSNLEEYEVDIPVNEWLTSHCHIRAEKIKGKWELNISSHNFQDGYAIAERKPPEVYIGWYEKWGEKDPSSNQYTQGVADAFGTSEKQAVKLATDAFWAEIKKLEP